MEYKYKCNECGHQFNLKSYNKSCQKCNSLNIDFTINHSDKDKRKKKYLWIFLLLIILITVGYLLKDIGKVVGGTVEIENSSIKYTAIYHEVENGNCVSFKLITEKYDTVPYNNDNHSFFNLTFSNITGSDIYNLNNNKLYPCEEGIRYTWDYDTSFMKGQNLLEKSEYVNPDEFVDFFKSNKAICKTEWDIIEVINPSINSDCKFFVLTNHPDNLLDSIQIDTIDFTYFTKGDNLIEISITGKGGPYVKQNEFQLDPSNSSVNVWARHINYPNDEPKYYDYNGSSFDSCQVYISSGVILEEDEESIDPKPNLFTKEDKETFQNEVEKVIKDILNNPDQIRQLSEQNLKLYLNRPWMYEGEDIRSRLRFKLKQNKLIIKKIEVSNKGREIIKIILIKE